MLWLNTWVATTLQSNFSTLPRVPSNGTVVSNEKNRSVGHIEDFILRYKWITSLYVGMQPSICSASTAR